VQEAQNLNPFAVDSINGDEWCAADDKFTSPLDSAETADFGVKGERRNLLFDLKIEPKGSRGIILTDVA
jgi:hypothetical protein